MAHGHDQAVSTPSPTWPVRLRGWLRELLVLALLLLFGLALAGWLRGPTLPEEAPPFTLRALDGSEVSLADLRGRTVILNFWATWCGPCRMELPTLQAFSDAHPELTVLGVALDDSRAVKRMVTAEALTYPMVVGDRAVQAAYGIHTFPTTVVVDAEGQVVAAHTGLLLRPHLEWLAWRAR